jgi:hypothetical protein
MNDAEFVSVPFTRTTVKNHSGKFRLYEYACENTELGTYRLGFKSETKKELLKDTQP